MPKMKSKSGAKKRFSLTGTGKIRRNSANKRHGMVKRTNKFIRLSRKRPLLAESDEGAVKKWLPYR